MIKQWLNDIQKWRKISKFIKFQRRNKENFLGTFKILTTEKEIIISPLDKEGMMGDEIIRFEY